MREVRPDDNETHFRRSTRRRLGLWYTGAPLLRNWHRHNPSKSANLRLNKAVIRWMSVVQEPSHSRAIGRRYAEANAVSIVTLAVRAAFFGDSSVPALAQAPRSSTGAHLADGGTFGRNTGGISGSTIGGPQLPRSQYGRHQRWKTHQDSELGNRREGGGDVTVCFGFGANLMSPCRPCCDT